MLERTVSINFRVFQQDIERLRELRDQLQAAHPGHRIAIADAFSLAVSSAGVALAERQRDQTTKRRP